jgi:hypothetical protein
LSFASLSFACAALIAAAGELGRGSGVVGFLLADGLALGERAQARRLAVGLRLLGLGAQQFGLGGRQLGLEWLGVEQEQRLPGAHRRSFLVEPFLDDAGDAGADLGILRAGSLSDVFEGDRE